MAAENVAQVRDANAWRGEREWPLWLLACPIAVTAAVATAIAAVTFDVVGATYLARVSILTFAVMASLGFVCLVCDAVWLALWARWRLFGIGLPMRRAVRAQVRNAMVLLGFLDQDAARWKLRVFRLESRPREGVMILYLDGLLLRNFDSLPEALLEARATEATSIEGEWIGHRRTGTEVYRLVFDFRRGEGDDALPRR